MLKDIKNLTPSELEKKVLKFWQDNRIFEKSIKKKSPKGDYVFYDGPPFANGLPHYGHILASIIKDVIPRYQTMRGWRVERRWGWDCHGLPVEHETEKELGFQTKKDIEKFGIEKFNEAAKSGVLRYADDWKKIIPRIGRWVDMENDYKTMNPEYTESIWWVFKSLYDKTLIYEGYKSMHVCPRCETTLANFEVSLGYKDIKDFSLVAKFELVDEPNTFVLAWTTTAWTLPGNVALAIHPKIDYAKIKIQDEFYILAKNRLEIIDGKYKILKTFKSSELIGKKYKPLFDYYSKNSKLENRENGWKIYGADFVTTDEGTGVVHIAPAFGEEDMNLGQKYNLPFIQHVGPDGKFRPEVKDFTDLAVKPKDPLAGSGHQSTDLKIIDWLASRKKLLSHQEIIHSYPFCWRCETPLINYAASSWFVRVTAIKKGKNGLIKNNKKITWVPSHIKKGRFGKWLEDARDWAISRSRFWGAPLPVWKCKKCERIKIIGSIEEIKKNAEKSGNKYFVMRHAEAESNIKDIANSKLEKSRNYPLTEKGIKQAIKAEQKLKDKKIDLIFSSDFARAKETAEIIAKRLKLNKEKIIFDKRLREINIGTFDGKRADEYHSYFVSPEEKFVKNPPGGENLTELKNRISEFLYDIDKKYSGKNILIISHEYPIWCLFAGASGADTKKTIEMKEEIRMGAFGLPKAKGRRRAIRMQDFIKTGEIKILDFTPLPHNKNYELDLHRPYIDKIEFPCVCGTKMKRVADVFDCWFESGSMPYGQAHYPFDPDSISSLRSDNYGARNKKKLKLPKRFPAEFIAEGIDQTRGWFYTLLVLSTALFGKPAFKNVIVNGIILAEDGQKMSKRLKNYPDPIEVVEKYGADALRLYLLSSAAVRAEGLNFSEKGVDEIYKKTISRLWNVYKFYELYAAKKVRVNPVRNIISNGASPLLKNKYPRQSASILDKWILPRLNQLIDDVSKAMKMYELDRAVRPINEFADDLSTWYIRRSRRRFQKAEDKKDFKAASEILGYILSEFTKIIAPFAPFIAEAIYKSLNRESRIKNCESVHLEEWPKSNKKLIDKKLIKDMEEIRRLASLALAERAKLGIKVRQPLQKLKVNPSIWFRVNAEQSRSIKSLKFKVDKNLIEILKDEINVKEIIFDSKIKNEIELDTKITPQLREEGIVREFVRAIQDLRQKAGYEPKNKVYLCIESSTEMEHILSRYLPELKKEVGAKNIEFRRTEKFDAELETKIDDQKIWIGIRKI